MFLLLFPALALAAGQTTVTTPSGSTHGSLVSGDLPKATGANTVTDSGLPSSPQGNGAKVQLSTGSTTTNDCVKYDANGNTVDAGSACGGSTSFANPTATCGTSAVNGSATTAMRSDAAPACPAATNATQGLMQGDGATITCAAGTCSATGGVGGSPAALDTMYFGDGSDGNVTISSGTTALTRDTYFENLTINGTGVLDCRNYKVFVSGTLDISSAPAGAIVVTQNGATRNGSNAVANAGGTAGATTANSLASLGTQANAASIGANGGTGAGSQANGAGSVTQSIIAPTGAASGAGGAVGATAGGASRSGSTSTATMDLRRLEQELSGWQGSYFKIVAGISAPGGSSGAGDGTGSGGGGGGGGAGGGVIYVAARTIARGTNTNAAIVTVAGGNGGNGASGTGGTNRGGGGGGGGGSGGWLYLIYRLLTGSTITGCLDATGGYGGAGANGVGTGNGGDGGGAGGGGRIDVYNINSGTQSITNTTAATAGNAHSGTTGGGAKTAAAQQASL